MIAYRFLILAEEEMTAAAVFYESSSAGLGTDFLGDVQVAVNTLRRRPTLGTPTDEHLRRLPLHRFPFSLIYAMRADELVVVAVAHQKRRPDYWSDRRWATKSNLEIREKD